MAQLVERSHGMGEVMGSSPIRSTKMNFPVKMRPRSACVWGADKKWKGNFWFCFAASISCIMVQDCLVIQYLL